MHWVSYSHFGAPFRHRQSKTSLVSIVLDGRARHEFSAIRLLIVGNEQLESLNKLYITTFLESERYDHDGHISRLHSTPRSRLHRRRADYQRSRDISSHISPNLPVYTVTFEAIPQAFISAFPPSVVLTPCVNHPFDRMRILYDHSRSVDASKPSLQLFLEGSHHFAPSFIYFGKQTLLVQVLPTVGRACIPWSQLGPEIIRRIVYEAIKGRQANWKDVLLSCGLVAKAWAHVLDLFFELSFDTHSYRDGSEKLDVLRIARCIEAKPERSALIRRIRYWDYKLDETDKDFDSGPDGWTAFLQILQYAASARTVYLPPVPEPAVGPLMLRLSKLDQVHTLGITDKDGSNEGLSKGLSMTQIQDVITNWKDLRNINIRHWRSAGVTDVTTPSVQLHGNLEVLRLFSGTIYGPQLSWFASLSKKCNLGELKLVDIKGITNLDFYSFLSSAAHSLRRINISACQFPRSSPKEELALDAMISRISNLETLYADGNHITCLTLVRKQKRTWIATSSALAVSKRDNIVLRLSSAEDNVSMAQVTAAIMDGTLKGWSSVTVLMVSIPTSIEEKLLMDRAIAAAQEQDIKLGFHNDFQLEYP